MRFKLAPACRVLFVSRSSLSTQQAKDGQHNDKRTLFWNRGHAEPNIHTAVLLARTSASMAGKYFFPLCLSRKERVRESATRRFLDGRFGGVPTCHEMMCFGAHAVVVSVTPLTTRSAFRLSTCRNVRSNLHGGPSWIASCGYFGGTRSSYGVDADVYGRLPVPTEWASLRGLMSRERGAAEFHAHRTV